MVMNTKEECPTLQIRSSKLYSTKSKAFSKRNTGQKEKVTAPCTYSSDSNCLVMIDSAKVNHRTVTASLFTPVVSNDATVSTLHLSKRTVCRSGAFDSINDTASIFQSDCSDIIDNW